MLERLQNASDATKRRFIIATVTTLATVGVITWLIVLPQQIENLKPPKKSPELEELEKQFKQTLEQTGQQAQQAQQNLQTFLTAQSEATATTTTTTDPALDILKEKIEQRVNATATSSTPTSN